MDSESVDIFIDTNVLLDVLAKRDPHYDSAARIWTLCEQGTLKGHISVINFNNIYYIVRKLRDKKHAHRMMNLMRDVFTPVALDPQILNLALGANFNDFEDAIQYHSALRAQAACLLTRNAAHFPKGALPILSPPEFLASQPPN